LPLPQLLRCCRPAGRAAAPPAAPPQPHGLGGCVGLRLGGSFGRGVGRLRS